MKVQQRCVRGRNYRRVMGEVTPDLVARAKVVIAETGMLTSRDTASFARDFRLPIKTVFNFLEYAEVLPSGTWERLPRVSQERIRKAVKHLEQPDLLTPSKPTKIPNHKRV